MPGNGTVGPWSATANFRSSVGGYIRGNEVFDPLTNGKSVGDVFGEALFLHHFLLDVRPG